MGRGGSWPPGWARAEPRTKFSRIPWRFCIINLRLETAPSGPTLTDGSSARARARTNGGDKARSMRDEGERKREGAGERCIVDICRSYLRRSSEFLSTPRCRRARDVKPRVRGGYSDDVFSTRSLRGKFRWCYREAIWTELNWNAAPDAFTILADV